jgi:biofilm protein TabA
MRKISFLLLFLLFSLSGLQVFAQSDSAQSTAQAADKWFQQKEWLNGLQLQPHQSTDKVTFARQYQLHKDYWDKAFAFLKNNNLQTMAPGRYAIDSNNVYALITENPTKDLDSAKWESHRNYIDLQYVISGEEKIDVAPVTNLTVTVPYDAARDLINYSGEGTFYTATPGTFFLFFPTNAHRPNITTDGNKPDKKVVIKIRYAE